VTELLNVLRVIQIAIVLLGSIITYLGFIAYRKHGNRGMLFMSIGFALISIGSSVAGLLFEFVGFTLLEAVVISAFANCIGFALLVYSIYGTK
jgi:hypothetical protein